MSAESRPFTWPYDRTPGGSMPSPQTTREEGHDEILGFALLSLLSTLIIAAVGVGVWLMVH